MQMNLKFASAAALALCAGACNTPTYECRDGRDTSGRGPVASLNVSCSAAGGTELLCNALRREVSVRKSGYAPHQRKLTVNSERVSVALELTPLGQ